MLLIATDQHKVVKFKCDISFKYHPDLQAVLVMKQYMNRLASLTLQYANCCMKCEENWARGIWRTVPRINLLTTFSEKWGGWRDSDSLRSYQIIVGVQILPDILAELTGHFKFHKTNRFEFPAHGVTRSRKYHFLGNVRDRNDWSQLIRNVPLSKFSALFSKESCVWTSCWIRFAKTLRRVPKIKCYGIPRHKYISKIWLNPIPPWSS